MSKWRLGYRVPWLLVHSGFQCCLQTARILKLWYKLFLCCLSTWILTTCNFLPSACYWFHNADSTAYSNAYFGQGSTIIIALDNVGCTGSEASLFSCSRTTSHNCGHTQDAGVQCVTREYIHNSSSLSTMRVLLLDYCRLYSWHNTASWWDIFPRESGSVCKWIVEYSVQP